MLANFVGRITPVIKSGGVKDEGTHTHTYIYMHKHPHCLQALPQALNHKNRSNTLFALSLGYYIYMYLGWECSLISLSLLVHSL